MRAVREHLPTNVLAGRELDEPAFAAVLHTHPQWELTLIRQGSGVRIVGDRIGPYRAGDLVLLGPDLPHCWTTSEGTAERSQATVLHFSPDIAALTASLPDTTPLQSLLAASRRGVVWPETPEALTTTLRAAAATTPNDPRLGALFTVLE